MLARVGDRTDVLLLDDRPITSTSSGSASLKIGWNALPRDMPVVISSHDRAFLDATTNRTLFCGPEQSQMFSCPIRGHVRTQRG